MQLELQTQGIRVTNRLRSHIERRVRSAVGRMGTRVQRVRVQLRDINGPRGGEDIQCRIQAQLTPRGGVMIEETCLDPFVAVATATTRVRRSLTRRVEKLQKRRRGRR